VGGRISRPFSFPGCMQSNQRGGEKIGDRERPPGNKRLQKVTIFIIFGEFTGDWRGIPGG